MVTNFVPPEVVNPRFFFENTNISNFSLLKPTAVQLIVKLAVSLLEEGLLVKTVQTLDLVAYI